MFFIKYIITISTIIFGFSIALSQDTGCQIESIDYKLYSAARLYNNGPFKNYKKMLKKDSPASYWTDHYENGRIIKRVFSGNTYGKVKSGQFNYENNLLKSVSFDGGFMTLIEFNYDHMGRLNRVVKHSSVTGIDTIKIVNAPMIARVLKGKDNDEIREINLDTQYNLYRYPYGAHQILDETFAVEPNFDSQEYDYKRINDSCGNMKYLIKTRKETKTIVELKVFSVKYRQAAD